MTTRRDAREWTVQLLFHLDFNPTELPEAFANFWKDRRADQTARQFTEKRVRGVMENRAQIDALIRRFAEHWDLERMGVIDRNVMRMAIYELLYCHDIPHAVIINEAVDIAKYFSSRESGRFVNGILDRARKEMERTPRASGSEGETTVEEE